jgi:hypothetical protein
MHLVWFPQEVGIRRQDHRQKVVDYIQKNFASGAWAQATAEAAAAAAAAAGPGRPFVTSPSMLTFCVEGNISAGKSTFLQYITEQRGVGREVLATDTKVSTCGWHTRRLLGSLVPLVPCL